MPISDVYPVGGNHVQRAHQARLLAVFGLLVATSGAFVVVLYEALGIWAVVPVTLALGVSTKQIQTAMHPPTPEGDRVEETTYPNLVGVVRRGADAYEIRSPDIFVYESPILLFVVGGLRTTHAQLITTTAMLDELRPDVLEAVVAHELAHLKDHHTLVANALSVPMTTVEFGLLGSVLYAIIDSVLAFVEPTLSISSIGSVWGPVVSPLVLAAIYMVLHLALSREREILADLSAAEYLGDVETYVDALATEIAATERRGWVPTLLRTHPPIESRVTAVRASSTDRR